LPSPAIAARPSLGEGNTPLLHLQRVSDRLGLPGLRLKNEGTNPTHSYKDRYQAVSVAHALGLGCPGCVCATTGNHGLAAAAYCAQTGLACTVFCHPETPHEMRDQMRALGARVMELEPQAREAAIGALIADGWYPSTTSSFVPLATPFGIEGYKTIAYELVGQCGGTTPEWVLCPVGGGDGLVGIWRGFVDLASLGHIDRLPRMVACQPAGANAVERAWREGLDEPPTLPSVSSLALSIRDAEAGTHILPALRASGGTAVAVDDDEIVDAAALLASCGLLVDPASAASVAGARRLAGTIGRASAVCIVTATGERWPVLRAALQEAAQSESAS
jgi:threonine synthase